MDKTDRKKNESAPEEPAPSLRLEWRSPAELAENPRNWRTHPETQIHALTDVLSEVGWAGACLFNERTQRLIDGHARRKVALEQGAEKVPVLVGNWTEEQEAKILATLDPIASMAVADKERLDALLRDVHTGSEALQQMLTDLAEKSGVIPGMAKPTPGAGGDEFVAEDVALGESRVKSGELWLIDGGRHRLFCGDSTKTEDLQKLLGGEQVALIVTSPPYNQNIAGFSKSGMHKETKWVDNTVNNAYKDDLPEEEYQHQQINAILAWKPFLKPDASIFYNHKNRYRDKQVVTPWRWLDQTGVKIRQEIIWLREGSVTMNARMFNPCDERIFWLYFGDNFYFSDVPEHRVWSSVWKMTSHKDKDGAEHPCAFPMELPTRCIDACSRPDDVVLEPYTGSGTTLIAAHRLGRRCFGMELGPKFCEVILRRAEAEGLAVERAEG